jgi:putative two-component system response regulator
MTASSAGSALVLIVDDEPPNRELLRRMLARDGVETVTAADGHEALAAVSKRAPDLVLLDIGLPGINGFEVCRALKASRATRLIPVVMVTGMIDRRHRISGIEAGADDFLSKPFDTEELKARVRSLLRLKRYTDDLESAESVILSLALTIEARDSYTEGHCQRLARFAVAMGRRLRLDTDDLTALERGGYLHDVGKVGIPDAVLRKPGRLTDAEFAQMKQHTVIGERLCGELRSLRLVRPIVRHHHERRDGSGYPDGLRGEQVPLLAEIVGITDVYDALTTDRSYRGAWTREAACAELARETALGKWRPDLVDLFIALAQCGELDQTPVIAPLQAF